MDPESPPHTTGETEETDKTAEALRVAAALEPPDTAKRYQLPPDDVVEIVKARATPRMRYSADGTKLAACSFPALPSIEDLAEPFIGLAGERLIESRFEARKSRYYDGFEIIDVASGTKTPVTGAEGRLSPVYFSPGGSRIAFKRSTEDGVELWMAPLDDGDEVVASKLIDEHLNDVLEGFWSWMPNDHGLIVALVPADAGQAPPKPKRPAGPEVLDTAGQKAQNRTYQDLLQSRHDELLMEHYFRQQLAIVGFDGKVRPLGDPGLYTQVEPSPDGRHLLVTRIDKPWLRSVPWWRFGYTVEVWSLEIGGAGDYKTIASVAPAEEVPIGGVRKGRRDFEWVATEPATLQFVEALDGGDPKKEVEFRDQVSLLAEPFSDAPIPLTKTEHRFWSIGWLEDPTPARRYFVREYDRDRRWSTTHLRSAENPEHSRVVFDRSVNDAYGDKGSPVYARRPDNTYAVMMDGESVFLDGYGASESGGRPFLDRFALPALDGGEPLAEPERIFWSDPECYEMFIDFVGGTDTMLIRSESGSEPPNYHRLATEAAGGRDGRAEGAASPITTFPHPHPELSSIEKRLLTYKRADGVSLSATLYLPPGAKEGEPLPTVVWAYPREFNDADTAGQVRADPTRFTRLWGDSPLLFLTQGYAVLDDATMPVVGDPETMNDGFLEQVVDSARAAIEAGAETGYVDPERVGVAGHSYGAFMTANLLAHSDLFRAGIARSGAYNRSLTPFGFQSERRTLWEAPQTYMRVSPLFAADRIEEPLLLIHGEVDSNSGTYPLQSRRLFHAMSGLGGTARLVLLPHESHGYRAEESVLHVLAESFRWFDRYVRYAQTRVEGVEEPAGDE